jgi:hypothetical protein
VALEGRFVMGKVCQRLTDGWSLFSGVRVRDDYTPERFGRLATVGPQFMVRGHRRQVLECDCGNIVVLRIGNIGRSTVSCGCKRRDSASETSYRHGHSVDYVASVEHCAWRAMKGRCLNSRNKAFKYYGGRGIKVCDRWLHSFENFYSDMGPRPSPSHSIERKEVNGDYEPSNCVWADKLVQANNKRTSRYLTVAGRTMTLAEWARESGINYGTLKYRLKIGWSDERAVTEPVETKYRNKTLGISR